MLKRKISDYLKKAVNNAYPNIGAKYVFDVFPPENEFFGHYATNAALQLASLKKEKPLIIAEKIATEIKRASPKDFFEKIEVAPPGFVNFWISEKELAAELKRIIALKNDYGRTKKWQGKKIMVEFTDPNPFKNFHIGHLYSNIIGETIAKVLEFNGATVKRANYQGDVGLHVAKSVWGMMEKMKSENITLSQLEKWPLDRRIKFMSQAYAAGAKAFSEDERAKLEIINLNKKIFALDKDVKKLYQKGRKWSLDYFETIYKRLGTKFDFYYFERDVGEIGLKIVKKNLRKSVFEKSEGAIVFPGEKYGLHRRVFINKEGLPTYEAKELGLAPVKFKDFAYDLSVVVTGNEITEYFKVLICALKKINPKLGEKIVHIAHGMVRLPQGKMSSRTGKVISGEELLDEVKSRVLKIMNLSSKEFPETEREKTAEDIAVGAVKYSFLKVSLGQDIAFSFDKSLSIHGDSGPYLQYALTRMKSVLKKSGRLPKTEDFSLLEKESEKNVVRQLVYFPEIVERAAETYETNVLTNYLFKLANLMNAFYENEQILKAEKLLRENRLNLILCATIVFENGLKLLGIEAPEAM